MSNVKIVKREVLPIGAGCKFRDMKKSGRKPYDIMKVYDKNGKLIWEREDAKK